MFDLITYLNEKRLYINSALKRILQEAPYPDSRLCLAMEYALMSEGKRLRPVLCLAACEAVGGNTQQALPAACALEMIHTYSLIHDDLPAMDNDHLRRGRPTCHIAFDEATAILAGDALLPLAFEAISSIKNNTVSAKASIEIISLISVAAGYKGMVEGQMRDIIAEKNPPLSLKELEKLHALKTGALIEASVCSGAIIGQGSSDQLDCLKVYSRHIGLAFQITDDILNVEGDSKIMGKETGTDHKRSKTTYPALLGLVQSKQMASSLVVNAIESLKDFDEKADPLRAIANYINERKR